MNHSQFVELYRQGRIKVHVDRSAAMHVCDNDPRVGGARRAAHKLWKNASFLLIVGGPVSIIWLPWYYGVGAFLLGAVIASSAQKSAAQFVLEAVLEDPSLFSDMLSRRVVQVTV